MEIKNKIYSGVFSNRCVFEPFSKETDKNAKGKEGVRCYSVITSFFIKIFGFQDKLINIKGSNGKILHLNKRSLDNWLTRHFNCKTSGMFKQSDEYVEAIKLVLIKQQQKKTTPAQKDIAAHQAITTLFGGEKEFEKLPILNIGDRKGKTGYIDFIEPGEMTAPIMRGKDCFDREFFLIRAKNSENGELTCIAFFARGEGRHGTWVTGLKQGLKPIMINDSSLAGGFDVQGGVVFKEEGFEMLKQFIANKTLGSWKIE